MKKIFFLAASAILLAAGCQKTEVINQVTPDGDPSMNFATNMGKLTKGAEDAGEANLKAQDFRLWAYYKADDANREGDQTNKVYDSMHNIKITDDESGKWNSTTTHFWPGKNKVLKFFAISADEATTGEAEGLTAAGDPVSSKVTVDPVSNTMTVTGFTVNPAAPDTDLMVANYVEAAQNGSDGYTSNTVPFSFKHALTKVEFKFKNTDAAKTDVYLQQMYVNGINTKADLTVTGTTDKTTLSWGTPTEDEIFAGDYAAPEGTPVLTYEDAENLTDWNQAECPISGSNYMKLTGEYVTFTTWLVIPQNVYVAGETEPTTDLKVTVAYLINTDNGLRQFVQAFSLGVNATGAVTSWSQNQYVKYNINLTPNIIGFSATVEPWTPADGSGVDINN